ncbi:MAG: hypothetical protein IKG72_06120 [Bacillus sp. (in: Bacteria)]|nr:hypothetical protein [Bacillus sp. (in: firmicutes)]
MDSTIAILDLRLAAFRVHLPAVAPLFEVAFPQHCTHNIQPAGGDDPFVSKHDFDARLVHEIPPFLVLLLYHGGLEITTFSAPVGCISTVLDWSL